MKANHYSTSYLQSKITVTKDSHPSGMPYRYSMYYRRRLVTWRDDNSIIYDIVSDPSSAESCPIAYRCSLWIVYNRLVDVYFETCYCQL